MWAFKYFLGHWGVKWLRTTGLDSGSCSGCWVTEFFYVIVLQEMAWMPTCLTKYQLRYTKAALLHFLDCSRYIQYINIMALYHASLSLQTTLPMFLNKTFSVRRRFSDFLGLYETVSSKHTLLGCIIPPPPQKSVVGKEFLMHPRDPYLVELF